MENINQNTDKTVSIVQLAIYVILLVPSQYNLWKHGKRGFLGWLYISLFVIVRLVGSGMEYSNDKSHAKASMGSTIVQNVGLSPLILGTLGVLHEARWHRGSVQNNKWEWFTILQYHMFVSGGVALIVVGIALLEGKEPKTSDWNFIKAGFAVVFLCWGALVLAALWSFRRPSQTVVTYTSGNLLLNAVFFVLPLILLRLVYGMITMLDGENKSKSTFPTSVPADILMNVVPMALIAIILIVAGLVTRNVARQSREAEKYGGFVQGGRV